MHAHAPPKEREAVLGPPIKKLTALCYHRLDSAQAVRSWQQEGERLLQEFRRTGLGCHWEAYMRHVAGVRQRLMSGDIALAKQRWPLPALMRHDYGAQAANWIDESYGYADGTGPCTLHDASYASIWNANSNETCGPTLLYPPTVIHMLEGAVDGTSAPVHAAIYRDALLAAGQPFQYEVVSGMGHIAIAYATGEAALEAAIFAGSPTPTPTPTPTPASSPTPTPTATPTTAPTSTPRVTPTPRSEPTPRLRPTPLPRPTV